MNDLLNREFGDYHIIRRLGSGATADVFLAEQRSLGRRIALKILKKDLASDEMYLRRFVQEAKAIAALNHPSLVQIYQTDCIDGYWFIAQEYVQGATLQQEIQRCGVLSADRVIDILWQIGAAFETAAESGIIHRDIKPDNILIGPNGVIKVTDFGLAHVKVSADHSHLALTDAGMTLGTPLYMSPEQAQGHELDHRSDIYSLGITCWHALVGRPPFTGATPLAVALQHVNDSPPPLVKERPDIPFPLAAAVERMIEKKPERRFQSFHAILQELQTHGLTPDRPILVSRAQQHHPSARQALQHALERRRTFWSRTIVLVLLFVVLIPLLGWSSGYAFRTLTAPPSSEEGISRYETVEEQWIHACLSDIPESWQAVVDYFPENEYVWGPKVRRQLIRCFFNEGDITNSSQLFGDAAYWSTTVEDRMLGFVGLAWCAAVILPNTKTAEEYLREYDLVQIRNPDHVPDELCEQIYDAAAAIIQQKKQ